MPNAIKVEVRLGGSWRLVGDPGVYTGDENGAAQSFVTASVLRGSWDPRDFAAEAVGAVVVDDAAGLHPGVDDDRADELEAAFS